MASSTPKLLRFRVHIFRSFLVYSLVVITGAAALVFATNKLTEDSTLRLVLDVSESASDLVVGDLASMPEHLRGQLAALPDGLHELETPGSEVQVHKRSINGASKYTFLRLNTDTVVTPFLLWLVAGTIAAIGLSILFSLRLARRFSLPIETIMQRLQLEQPMGREHQDIFEFSKLMSALDSHHKEQALRLAQEANFAQSVSHELRTPITVVMGALELMLADAPSDKQVLRLLRIKRANDNMRWTVEALLSLTQAETSALAGDMSFRGALLATIEQAKSTLQPGVRVATNIIGYPDSRHEWAPLLVALQTLLTNAVTHTRTGSIEIGVSGESARVNDTGEGLSDDALAQARNNVIQPGSLGLSMVHRICERCDWALTIESNAQGKNTGTSVALAFSGTYSRPTGSLENA